MLSSNIACTVLKVQEKKTQKGNSYAIVKFSDLSNVFELFIFSDIFELNREALIEGNSLMITLMKNYSDEERTQKRINVKKIIKLKEVIDKPISNITFKVNNIEDFNKINKLSTLEAETNVQIMLEKQSETYTFRLKKKRKVNNNQLNSLDLIENIVIK